MNFQKLDQYFHDLGEKYGIHGADLKVMKDHQVIYRSSFGWKDYEQTVPVSKDDLYDVYSCTKVITMTAAMQCVEKGLFSLDDEAGKYIPSFDKMMVSEECWPFSFPNFKMPTRADKQHEAPSKVTIRQLMAMTSGLTYDLRSEGIREALEKDPHAGTLTICSAIGTMPLLFDPGTHWSYSLGHDIVAGIIEVVTGMKYRDYLEENIFKPLGLKNMFMHVPENEKYRLAAQYASDWTTGEIKKADTGNQYRLTDEYDSGGAGLCCTVDDYSLVIDALASGGIAYNGYQLLSMDSIDQLRKQELIPAAQEDFTRGGIHRGYGYGLGVRTLIDQSTSKGPLGEFGWDGAAGAYNMIDPENHVSIYYAQQVLGMGEAYATIHPTIRDLVYEGLAADPFVKYQYRDEDSRGRIERLEYEHPGEEGPVSKYVNVYLPADYDEKKPYDVLYMMHGGGGNPDAWLDASMVKNMLDRMIKDGSIRPIICVFPTYYPGKARKDRFMDRDYDRNLTKAFAKELRNEVIPLVETAFSTYAKDVTEEGQRASRDHRAFTGFSMGACSTWYMFLEDCDIIHIFLPLSGDCWALEVQGGRTRAEETAAMLKQHVLDSGMTKEEFCILGATGTEDIAYPALSAQMEAMLKYPEVFDASENGNFTFYVEEGQRHSYDAVNRYLEVLLPRVFPKY